MPKTQTRSETSALEQERQALLKKALAQPGIPEVMRVHKLSQATDKALDPYRTATRKSFEFTDTNRTNPR